jgi:hypothetical protein
MAIQLGHGVKSDYFSVRLINFFFFSLTCVSLTNPAFYVNLSPHYYTDPRMKVVSILWAVPVPRTTWAVGHYGFFFFFSMPRTYRGRGFQLQKGSIIHACA